MCSSHGPMVSPRPTRNNTSLTDTLGLLIRKGEFFKINHNLRLFFPALKQIFIMRYWFKGQCFLHLKKKCDGFKNFSFFFFFLSLCVCNSLHQFHDHNIIIRSKENQALSNQATSLQSMITNLRLSLISFTSHLLVSRNIS